MAKLPKFVQISDLRGGRNGFDPPLSIPENQVVEALNVDYQDGLLARKRGGSTALSSIPGSTSIQWGFRHLPSADESAAEAWLQDGTNAFKRYSGGAWGSPTVTDAATGIVQSAASVNGKMFVAYPSAVDRLHVFDGSTLRRVGLPAPSAAPTSVLAAGSVTDTRKYYSRVTKQASGVTIMRSELSPITGSIAMSAQQNTMTLAGAPGEGETHWELYATSSVDNFGNIWLIGTVAIGNTIVDNNVTAAGATGVISDPVGTYTLPWSAKYVLSDGNRILFAGSNVQTALASRVGYSSDIGGTNISDDERNPETTVFRYYADLDRGSGGGITGLAGPLNGAPYAFKLSQIFKLVRTGTATTPYVPTNISKTVGALGQPSIVLGEDETGNPALYFLDRTGPYRLGSSGLQRLGNDVFDIFTQLNQAVPTAHHGIFYPLLKQVWWFICTGSNTVPDTKIVFDCKRGVSTAQGIRQGFMKHTGAQVSNSICSFMWPKTLGSVQSLDLRPHVGRTTPSVWQCDTSALDDNGTAFQAYILTKPYSVASIGYFSGVNYIEVLARASSTTLGLTIIQDFGLNQKVCQGVSLAPSASETRVVKEFEDAMLAKASTIQFQIGDTAPIASPQWVIDALAIKFTIETAIQ